MEKIPTKHSQTLRSRKHPHVCGENSNGEGLRRVIQETPPHTWRKLSQTQFKQFFFGNTSTYVEKTTGERPLYTPLRKHLHVCGENSLRHCLRERSRETPPRMWRKPLHCLRVVSRFLKHLHVCGENLREIHEQETRLETPPRMWRKRRQLDEITAPLGNTSTYVEKTVLTGTFKRPRAKHLHVCGENFSIRVIPFTTGETPPRMWRKQVKAFSR